MTASQIAWAEFSALCLSVCLFVYLSSFPLNMQTTHYAHQWDK